MKDGQQLVRKGREGGTNEGGKTQWKCKRRGKGDYRMISWSAGLRVGKVCPLKQKQRTVVCLLAWGILPGGALHQLTFFARVNETTQATTTLVTHKH
jgi:hypothetical protein